MSPWWLKPAQDEHQPPPGPGIVKADSGDPTLFILGGFFATITLSMIATWFLVDRYPFPNDDAIYVGLLCFLFVGFLDLALVVYVVAGKLATGQFLAAAKSGLKAGGLGFLIASLAGVLPWCFKWLLSYFPWISRNVLLVLLLLVQLISAWRLRRAKKSTRP